MNDHNVERRWPEIIEMIAPHGLEARFVVAEDGDVDDAIEIRPMGGGEDDDLGDIQFVDGGWFGGNSWTSRKRDERRHGVLHRTVLEACEDMLRNLKQDGMI